MMDSMGPVVRRDKVASEQGALIAWLQRTGVDFARIDLAVRRALTIRLQAEKTAFVEDDISRADPRHDRDAPMYEAASREEGRG